MTITIYSDDAGPHADCHRIATIEFANSNQSLNRFVITEIYKEVMATYFIWRMFEQDFSETQTNEGHMSQEDRTPGIMRTTSIAIHKAEDGHYELSLPFCEKP